MAVKKWTNETLQRFGYQLQRVPDGFEVQRRLCAGAPVLTVLDVGANVGNATARYRALFPDATVHAFEPFQGCVDALEARFGDDERVRIFATGVGAHEARTRLFVSGGKSTHSTLPRPVSGPSYHPAHAPVTGEVEIPMTTLDLHVEREGIDTIDILKIDVEGGEAAVLEGARGILSESRARVLYVEVMFVPHYEGQALFHELTGSLLEHGYGLYDIPTLRKAESGQLRWGDAVYVSEPVRRAVIDAGRG